MRVPMKVRAMDCHCLHKELTFLLMIKVAADLHVKVLVVSRSGRVLDNLNVSVFSDICRPCPKAPMLEILSTTASIIFNLGILQ